MEQEQQQLRLAQQRWQTREITRYKGFILNAIASHWLISRAIDPKLSCQFLIDLQPDGTVARLTLIRSSGDSVLDQSARAAILKASPLPVPHDAKLFAKFKTLNLTVSPQQVVRLQG